MAILRSFTVARRTQGLLRLFGISSLFLGTTFIFWQSYIFYIEWSFFTKHYYVIVSESPTNNTCKIPLFKPFDKIVLPYIKKLDSPSCGKMQPYLTYMDSDGLLHLNATSMEEEALNSVILKCSYQTFKRKDGNDSVVQYDELQNVTLFPVTMPKNREFLNVSCSYEEEMIYQNVHYVVRKGVPLNAKDQRKLSLQPKVFIFVVESLSRLNFERHMQKTSSYLLKEKGFEVLKGLTKVADNSFPNMVPFLTGHRVYVDPPEFPPESMNGPFDDWPFVWKNFTSAGYVTGLLEDNPDYTLLNYMASGLLYQQTNFYPRPFWLSMLSSDLWTSNGHSCFGNTLKGDIFLRMLEQYIEKHHDIPYFMFSFLIQPTHDNFNSPQFLDNKIYELFHHFFEFGKFNETIVIFMGDHGNRYGDVLKTVIGWTEERMPLFSIYLPPFLEKAHPHLRKYLRLNSMRLTSWLDIHSLLMDIATETYHPSPPQHVWNLQGFSPWRMEIPLNRTCEDAGIKETYCVCEERREINSSNIYSVEASKQLVIHVNNMLSVMSGKCALLILDRTIRSELYIPNKSGISKKRFQVTVHITVQVKPSGAILDGMLRSDAWNPSFQVIGDVTRLNKYGNQSSCIRDRELRKFCYCF